MSLLNRVNQSASFETATSAPNPSAPVSCLITLLELTRFLIQCFIIDDYWKKFFLADDIAMLLTDVARSVSNVENFLQKQNGGRRISRSSFKRSSVISPLIVEVSRYLISYYNCLLLKMRMFFLFLF